MHIVASHISMVTCISVILLWARFPFWYSEFLTKVPLNSVFYVIIITYLYHATLIIVLYVANLPTSSTPSSRYRAYRPLGTFCPPCTTGRYDSKPSTIDGRRRPAKCTMSTSSSAASLGGSSAGSGGGGGGRRRWATCAPSAEWQRQ